MPTEDRQRAVGLAEDSWSELGEVEVLFVAPEALRSEWREVLEAEGCSVRREENSDHLSSFREEPPDVVIVDVGAAGATLEALAIEPSEATPITLLRVDEYSPQNYRKLTELGMDTFVHREVGPTSLMRIIEQELRARLDGDSGALIETSPFIGESEDIHRICKLIAGAAPSNASSLITGESGVGKELVARAVHRLSPRRRRPFVAVNCGAIPDNLIESQLFGHEEGAFTGATSQRAGRFEQADTGTLFLDEIGEIPSQMQVELLRVLEEQRFERVGGEETVSVDVRILSATNRDLTEDVERDKLRRDLFFRLNVLEIDVPPLREHREDIPLLWEYFIRDAAAKEARPAPETSPEVRRKLYRYDWPGNVRELRNVARHAVALSTADELRVEHLPGRFREELDRQLRRSPGDIQVPGMTLDEVERATIIRTHQWTSNAGETAEMLGISERKVYYKLKEYREEGYLSDETDGDESQTASESADSDDEKPRLVIAEDDRQLQWTLRELLESDYDVETVTTGKQLVEEVRERRPDVILSDIRMPGLDGIQVLRQSQTEEWNIPIILLTAFGDDENRAQADLLGAEALLDKPLDIDSLREELRCAVEHSPDAPPADG